MKTKEEVIQLVEKCFGELVQLFRDKIKQEENRLEINHINPMEMLTQESIKFINIDTKLRLPEGPHFIKPLYTEIMPSGYKFLEELSGKV